MRLGVDWTTLLRQAGQPQQRTRVWTWCVRGTPNPRAADVAVLNDAGVVQLVGSNARGRRARGVSMGARAARLRGKTRSIGGGVRIRRARRFVWVYVVRRGRVRAEAVATRSLARHRATLRRTARLLLTTHATQAQPTFEPSAAQAARAGAVTGRTLAGSSNVRLNNALALLCHLQAQ
jgi:hypothetical protein